MNTATETISAEKKQPHLQVVVETDIERKKIERDEKIALGLSWSASVSKWEKILTGYKTLAANEDKEAAKKIPEVEKNLTTAKIYAEIQDAEKSAGWETAKEIYQSARQKIGNVSSEWQADFRSRIEKDLEITNANIEGKKIESELGKKETATWSMNWGNAEKEWKKLEKKYKEAKGEIGLPEKYKSLFAKKATEMKENAKLSAEHFSAKKLSIDLEKKEKRAINISDWKSAKSAWEELKNEYSNAPKIIKYQTLFARKKNEMSKNIAVCNLNLEFDTVYNSEESWSSVLGKYISLKSRASGLRIGKLQSEISESITISKKNIDAKKTTTEVQNDMKKAVASLDWDDSKTAHEQMLQKIKRAKNEKLTEKRKAELRGVELEIRRNISACTKEIQKDIYEETEESMAEVVTINEKKESAEKNDKLEKRFAYLASIHSYLFSQQSAAEKNAKNQAKEVSGEKMQNILEEGQEKKSEIVINVSEADSQAEEGIPEKREKLSKAMQKGEPIHVVSAEDNQVYAGREKLKQIERKILEILREAGVQITSREQLQAKLKAIPYSTLEDFQ